MKTKSPRTIILSVLLLSGFITIVFGVNAAKFYGQRQSESQSAQSRSVSSHNISNSPALLAALPPVMAACGAGTVATASSPILYRDAGVANVTDEYVAYKITNTTGSPIADLWVRLTPCVACNVTLSTNEDGLYHVGPLGTGAMTTVYFYVHTTAATNTPQNLAIDLFNGNPTGGGTLVCGPNPFAYTIEETIKANANKPDAVVVSAGACYVMTVTGMTGTIGSGNGSIMAFTPSADPTFNADGYQLSSVSIDLNGTVTNDTLYLSGLSSPDKPYKITYTFCPLSPIGAPPSVPITWISSGTQIKHTDPDTSGNGTVFLSSSKSVSPTGTVSPGTKLTYTVGVTNSGNADATGMTLVDVIPANTTYVTSSTTLNGTAVADVAGAMPYATSNEIHSTGAASGTIAAGQTATVVFMVTVNSPTAATSVSNFATFSGTNIPSTDTNAVTTPICQPPATPTISGTLSFCQGGSTTLTASGTGTYMWFLGGNLIAGQTTNMLTVNAAGSYTVKVTDANSCASATSAPAVVTVNTPVVVDAGVPQTVSACAALGGIKLAGVIGGSATSAT